MLTEVRDVPFALEWGHQGGHRQSALSALYLMDDRVLRTAPLILPPRPDRFPLIREAFKLEWFTIGWMTVEAVVAIGAGVSAGSLVLLAFGLDSVIELASAGVLMWRLSVELRHGAAPCCSSWQLT